MESSRRQQAQSDLGMNFEREDLKRNAALAKEQERVEKKQAKREQMMNRSSYRMMVKTAKYMDKYYLDPLIGLIPGGVGDTISSLLAFPFIYYSLCVVKSIPLTLAVIYNILIDVMLGAIPVIGNVFDIFKRSYVDNLKLITGYIEDDKDIITITMEGTLVQHIIILISMGFLPFISNLLKGKMRTIQKAYQPTIEFYTIVHSTFFAYYFKNLCKCYCSYFRIMKQSYHKPKFLN